MGEVKLTRRSLRDELAFLLDSTVDLPAYDPSTGTAGYDRDTLLMRLECAVEVLPPWRDSLRREREAYVNGFTDARMKATLIADDYDGPGTDHGEDTQLGDSERTKNDIAAEISRLTPVLDAWREGRTNG